MKRLHILTIFAVLTLLLCCILPTRAEAATEGYYTYEVSNGEATITYCDKTISGDITIPSVLGGYPVTSIGESAFEGCDALTSVTLCDGVTNVGALAFSGCCSLTVVTFGENSQLTRIDDLAFAWCDNLTEVTLPDSVINFGSRPFAECDSINFNVYDNGKYLGNAKNPYLVLIQARSDDITSCAIHPDTKVIGSHAFYDCTNLSDIEIPTSVVNIALYAFSGCNVLTDITIPASVTELGMYAFSYCDNLSEITFAENSKMNRIGYAAFYSCYGLTRITIPDSVTNIDNFAFPYCEKLTDVKFGKNSQLASIGGSAFYYCTGLRSITIPDSVISIDVGAFQMCRSLENVILPNGITNLSADTFSGCSSLTSITIPDSVTSLGADAFSFCSSLTSITIPNSVTRIDAYAFIECSNLKSVAIGNGVISVGNEAFDYCDNLDHVAYAGTKEQWGKIAIGDCNGSLTGASKFHYETAFETVDNCVEMGVYCPVCSDFVIRNKKENGTHLFENGICTGCGRSEFFRMALTEDTVVDLNLEQDLYVGMNGYDLTGTIITNGYKIYGMDSTTDNYTCDSIGYFTCVDENGNYIVPERIYTEGEKQYMAICTEDRYSFHRFFVGTTHMSLEPEAIGLGYKAAVFGDEMVFAELAETKTFSFKLQLEGYNPVYRHFGSSELASGDPITLRIRNYDVDNYSEHNLYAQVSLTLNDGTVIETEQVSLTFRWLTEQVNENYTDYTADQLASFKAMLQQFDIVKKWNIPNLI